MHAMALLAGLFTCTGDSSAALQGEVIAGCDANSALIERGRVTYTAEATTTQLTAKKGAAKPEPHTRSFPVEVHFKADRLRCDYESFRSFLDGQRQVDYRVLDDGRLSPLHHVAQSDVAGRSTRLVSMFHPRAVGHSLATHTTTPFLSVADLLRKYRDAPGVEIKATKEGDLIRCSFVWRKAEFQQEVWVSPAAGYGIVRRVDRVLVGQKPALVETMVDYKLVDGAYIASSYVLTERAVVDDQLQDVNRLKLSLVQADLKATPPDELFTPEGLGLPRGARLVDKTTGNTHIIGSRTVSQQDLDDAITDILIHGDSSAYIEPWWRRAGRYALWGGGVLAVVGGLWLLFRRVRRRPSA